MDDYDDLDGSWRQLWPKFSYVSQFRKTLRKNFDENVTQPMIEPSE